MTGRLIDLSVGLNHKQRITIEVDQDFREKFDELNGQELDIDIKKHRSQKKRSLDANRYFWTMLDKLAEAMNTTKGELYLLKVREVGVFKDFQLTEDEYKTFRVAWESLGQGWPTEQVDYSPDGERLIIRAYYGSSQYNVRQMARLIDSVVEDCKEQGISVLSDRELSLLKEEWGKSRKGMM